jgi:hypothetical protein
MTWARPCSSPRPRIPAWPSRSVVAITGLWHLLSLGGVYAQPRSTRAMRGPRIRAARGHLAAIGSALLFATGVHRVLAGRRRFGANTGLGRTVATLADAVLRGRAGGRRRVAAPTQMQRCRPAFPRATGLPVSDTRGHAAECAIVVDRALLLNA